MVAFNAPDQEAYQKVLDYLNEELEDHPNEPSIYFKKAEILFDLENLSAAEKNLNEALRLNKQKPEYYILAARIYAVSNRTDKAAEASLQAQKYGGNVLVISDMLSDVYIKKGKHAEAIKYAEQLIKVFPDVPEYQYRYGIVSLRAGDTSLAIQNFDKVIANDSSFAIVYKHFFDIYSSKNDLARASFNIKRYLDLRPEDQEAKLAAIEYYLYRKDLKLAKHSLYQWLKKDTLNQTPLQLLADTYFQESKWDSALYFNQKIIAASDSSLNAMLMNARLWDKKWNYAKAQVSYEFVVTQDSTNNLAKDELATLKRKIAYLRKLKEERAKPLPLLEPIRIERKELQE